MNQPEEHKRAAANAAAEIVESGMAIGLGTGSTVEYLLQSVAQRLSSGELRDLRCVPTSNRTTRRAAELGIPLCTFEEVAELQLCIDGADEVDPNLDLVKGLGGALLREKIVAAASRHLVIIADEAKLVPKLGTRAPVPVEVDPFGAPTLLKPLRRLGAEPQLRRDDGGEPFRTDGGNFIYDCWFAGGVHEPAALERDLNALPGVLENGLFVERAATVVVGGAGAVRTIMRSGA